jgi:hypothetical protein
MCQLQTLEFNIRAQKVVLPTHNDDEELANRFGDFFLGKIETIRDNLKASRESLHSPDVLSADVKFEGSGVKLRCTLSTKRSVKGRAHKISKEISVLSYEFQQLMLAENVSIANPRI